MGWHQQNLFSLYDTDDTFMNQIKENDIFYINFCFFIKIKQKELTITVYLNFKTKSIFYKS